MGMLHVIWTHVVTSGCFPQWPQVPRGASGHLPSTLAFRELLALGAGERAGFAPEEQSVKERRTSRVHDSSAMPTVVHSVQRVARAPGWRGRGPLSWQRRALGVTTSMYGVQGLLGWKGILV